MKSIALVSLLFAGTTGTVTAQSAGKLNLSKGLKLQIENTVKSLVTQEMMGQTMEIKSDAVTNHMVEVKDKKEASYMVTSTITRIKSNTSMMGQEMNFDSDKKEDLEGEQGQMFKEVINVPKEFELSDVNKVVNAPGTSEKKEEKGGGMMSMMGGLSSGDADETNGASAAFQALPADLKVGKVWEDSVVSKEVKTNWKYTVKDIKDNFAQVTYEGTMQVNKTIEQAGMEVNVKMNGKLSGEEKVEIATGIIREKTANMDANGDAEVMGQSIPITTKTTTITTVK